MHVFGLIDEASVLSGAFLSGNRHYVAERLGSNEYTQAEAVALAVLITTALPSDKVDFFSDILNNLQETEEDLGGDRD